MYMYIYIYIWYFILCGNYSQVLLVSSDLLFCSYLNPHEEASGNMHSIASLTTDVRENIEEIFSYFELNLLEFLKAVQYGL